MTTEQFKVWISQNAATGISCIGAEHKKHKDCCKKFKKNKRCKKCPGRH